MAGLARDHTHLRSATLSDIVPRGLGNTAAGRLLREHERIIAHHFERAGIEMTELARILAARLGRIALQIAELERRLDKEGKLAETEFRIYTSLSGQYTGIVRELVLHRHKYGRPASPEPPLDETANQPSSLAAILAEMSE
jgi:hypothetical protein